MVSMSQGEIQFSGDGKITNPILPFPFERAIHSPYVEVLCLVIKVEIMQPPPCRLSYMAPNPEHKISWHQARELGVGHFCQ